MGVGLGAVLVAVATVFALVVLAGVAEAASEVAPGWDASARVDGVVPADADPTPARVPGSTDAAPEPSRLPAREVATTGAASAAETRAAGSSTPSATMTGHDVAPTGVVAPPARGVDPPRGAFSTVSTEVAHVVSDGAPRSPLGELAGGPAGSTSTSTEEDLGRPSGLPVPVLDPDLESTAASMVGPPVADRGTSGAPDDRGARSFQGMAAGQVATGASNLVAHRGHHHAPGDPALHQLTGRQSTAERMVSISTGSPATTGGDHRRGGSQIASATIAASTLATTTIAPPLRATTVLQALAPAGVGRDVGAPGPVRSNEVRGAVSGAGPPAGMTGASAVLRPSLAATTPTPVADGHGGPSQVSLLPVLPTDQMAGSARLSVAATTTTHIVAVLALLASLALFFLLPARSRPSTRPEPIWLSLRTLGPGTSPFPMASNALARGQHRHRPNPPPPGWDRHTQTKQGALMHLARTIPGGDRRKAVLGLLVLLTAMAMLLVAGSGTARAEQTASVDNEGTATADTGGNVAVGNASHNEASNDQDADARASGRGGDAVAANAGSATNSSDGTAVVKTGDARAAGVVAKTAVNQQADGTRADQSARVSNDGEADASTGGNVAVGNASRNEASNDQDADATARRGGDAVAVNHGGAANSSHGTAVVETGDAEAVGVVAHTAINQESTNEGCCARRGGGADQSVEVDNDGEADAHTGDNIAVGNASRNEASNDQDADARARGRGGCDRCARGGDAVAINFGGASNWSDGTAVIETGDARAAGVVAWTFVNQRSTNEGCCARRGGGADQSVEVDNDGEADAHTGGNIAVGNASRNEASNDQDADARARGRGGDALAINFGGAFNRSDGTAVIETGDATAVGVVASTFVNQVSQHDGDEDCKRDRCDRDCKRDRCDRDCKRDRCDRDCKRDRCDEDCKRDRCDRDCKRDRCDEDRKRDRCDNERKRDRCDRDRRCKR